MFLLVPEALLNFRLDWALFWMLIVLQFVLVGLIHVVVLLIPSMSHVTLKFFCYITGTIRYQSLILKNLVSNNKRNMKVSTILIGLVTLIVVARQYSY